MYGRNLPAIAAALLLLLLMCGLWLDVATYCTVRR